MKSHIKIISASLLIALLAHLYFIIQTTRGTYMVGHGDGVSQMLVFKKLLFEQWSKGEWFYADHFGLGGDIFAGLGYYYSTSIVFILTCVVVYLLATLSLIDPTTIVFWAQLTLFVSIVRMTFISFFAFLFLNKIFQHRRAAWVGSVVYATSVIYFRHVFYWEFFADALLWLPLLLLGIEKIIRKESSYLFIFAVAISLFDNFYFAYINFLLAFIYICMRFLSRWTDNEASILQQIGIYIRSGLIGFCLGAVSFIPSAIAFFNNYRPDYPFDIPLFEWKDSLLFNGKTMWMPLIVPLLLGCISFYRHRLFRSVSLLLLFMWIVHYSPKAASIFNGFSAPQFRWEYFIGLLSAMLVTFTIIHWRELQKRDFIGGALLTLMLYTLSYHSFPRVKMFQQYEYALLLIIGSFTLLFVISGLLQKRQMWIGTLLLSSIVILNLFASSKLAPPSGENNVTAAFLNSDHYNPKATELLLHRLTTRDSSFYRIDWMVPTRNNTPLVQQFNGMSVYSSILNKHVLLMYWHDLQIDMKRETVSRYMTGGSRLPIYQMMQGKYTIVSKKETSIPSSFKQIDQEGDYILYENQALRPFVHFTSAIYEQESLSSLPTVDKENIALHGLITEELPATQPTPTPSKPLTVLEERTKDATYDNQLIVVSKKKGTVTFLLDGVFENDDDVYVQFSLQRLDQDKGFTLKVNEYETTRKKNSSIYRTFADDLTIRVQGTNEVKVTLPQGTYELKNLAFYPVKHDDIANNSTQKVKWEDSTITIQANNESHATHAILPVPYEKGWKAQVNGKQVPVIKANYAFIALPVEEGMNNIDMHYRTPYVWPLSILSLFTFSLLVFRKIKK